MKYGCTILSSRSPLTCYSGGSILTWEEYFSSSGFDAGGEWIDIDQRCSNPEHVQDDLRILGIVPVSAIVERFPRPGQRNRGDETQIKPGA
jgi:hypothetical protein